MDEERPDNIDDNNIYQTSTNLNLNCSSSPTMQTENAITCDPFMAYFNLRKVLYKSQHFKKGHKTRES